MKKSHYDVWLGKMKQSAKENKIPLAGFFELTSRCNLDCKMCYIHSQKNCDVIQRELSTEQWFTIMDEAYDCGMMLATLSGGECTVRQDFKELYMHLYEKGIHITLFTNGTTLTDETIAFLVEHPPKTIQISLYGSSEENYERVTGHRMYERAVSAITKLKKAGLNLRIAITPSRYLKDDYANILKYCSDNKLTIDRAEMYLYPKRDKPEKEDYLLSAEEIIELLKQREGQFRDLKPLCDLPRTGGSGEAEPDIGCRCSAGGWLAFISWEGYMYPCANMMINGQKVLEVGYQNAWKEINETASKLKNAVECKGCAYTNVCSMCPAIRLDGFDSGHCNKNTCVLTKMKCEAGLFEHL